MCCCIEKCSSRLGLLCYAFGWSRCTASFRSRRESLWIDVKRMVEELLNELIDRDKIELTYRLRPTYLYHIPSSDAIRKLNLTSQIVKRCCCSLISSSRAKHLHMAGRSRSLPDTVSSALTAAQDRHAERKSRSFWEVRATDQSACARNSNLAVLPLSFTASGLTRTITIVYIATNFSICMLLSPTAGIRPRVPTIRNGRRVQATFGHSIEDPERRP